MPKEYKYCYQCCRSLYDKIKNDGLLNFRKGELVLYCAHRKKHIRKDALCPSNCFMSYPTQRKLMEINKPSREQQILQKFFIVKDEQI